jgi:transcriptional regulator with AAA-type ATPase domain
MSLMLSSSFMFMNIEDEFLNPLALYQGETSLAQYMFNANLQEFANKVDLLCALQTGNKISAEDAYAEIRKLWKELKLSKKNLLGEPTELGS